MFGIKIIEKDKVTLEKLLANNTYHDITWFEDMAESGNVEAQFEVATYYDRITCLCERVNRDKLSFKWYEQSAKQGNKNAMFCLGQIYSLGSDAVEENDELCGYWLNMAEKYGVYDYSNLNETLLYSEFKKGYEQGDLDATLRLALCSYNGTPEDKDVSLENKLLEEAAEKGLPLALYLLAEKTNKENPTFSEKEKMYELYQLAAKRNNLGARQVLIEPLMTGNGVPQDFSLALEYAIDVSLNYGFALYRKLANIAIGDIYLFGLSGTYDLKKAIFYYKSAIKEDNLYISKYQKSIITDNWLQSFVVNYYHPQYKSTWQNYTLSQRVAEFITVVMTNI